MPLTSEEEYLAERASILSTAVGIARMKLQRGDAAGALDVLDRAAADTRRLLYDALVERGNSPERVEMFLGPRELAR